MVKLSDSDILFVKKNMSPKEQDKILSAKTVRQLLHEFYVWIDMNESCWEANGEDYSDLGRAAQRVYDNIYLYAEEC